MMYKLVAPDVDTLLRHFDRGFRNHETPSRELLAAMDPLFSALSDLAPCKANDEAKIIWITVPRGELSDYGSFEEAKEYGEVETEEEFEEQWREECPDEVKWYRLTIGESKPGARFQFRSVALDNSGIISADLSDGLREETWYAEEPQITLCKLLTEAAQQSMALLHAGTYNAFVKENLPYQHRTGVIRRTDEWRVFPEEEDHIWEGMDGNTFLAFRSFLETNNANQIGRIKSFTANDFFRACVAGYRACGYDLSDLSPSEAYLRYADGRDEGLTGTGHGLNEGPGIDFDSASAWDEWYNSPRGGGHPWEVVRGGNSTHVELYVMHDGRNLDFELRTGKISQEEHDKKMAAAGYYFCIAGKHRPEESIKFFVALREEGLPVYLHDADEILARYEGTDYIGIVRHRTIPKYCEDMFPDEYGRVIDFMHFYSDEKDLLPYVT